jgi:hypothetical protein
LLWSRGVRGLLVLLGILGLMVVPALLTAIFRALV